MKVATCLASATEIVCAVGGRALLVGVSHECDWPLGPDGIGALPRLTRTRITDGSSQAIHDDVERLVRDALAIYDIDLAALAAAAPDLVITQDLCRVCAVAREDVEAAVRSVVGKDVRVLSLAPRTLDEVFADIVRVGDALDLGLTARAAVTGLRARLAAVSERAAAAAAANGRPRVLALEWLTPPMVGGLWMPELIQHAGGEAVLTLPAPDGDGDSVGVDVVVAKPCGFGLARTLAEADQIGSYGAARVFAADGNAFFNRSGPRLVDSVEILAACLHPATFPDLVRRHAGRYQQLAPRA